jgi:N-acetylglutamate synthase-like GNAT family acetyltransferase
MANRRRARGTSAENDLESLFAFTYVSGFFSRLGFLEVDRGELPLKAWKDCLRCLKFHACDEIAMLKRPAEHRTAFGIPCRRI